MGLDAGSGVLIFGKSGQLARELAARLPAAVCLDRGAADLSDPASCAAVIRAQSPRLVINAAAHVAVDKAEDEEALVTTINAEAPAAMGRACADLSIPFLSVSTDYVFDGSGDTPWSEADAVAPLNVYGRSKAAGEAALAEIGGAYAVLRTSWVFSAHGGNFVKTMLRLSETRDALNVVADQVGGPTAAGDIAEALIAMGAGFLDGRAESGVYHFAGGPDVSWAEFADAIFAAAGREVAVTGIPSSDYPTPAARPLNSRLDCSRIEQVFGVKRPDWRESLRKVLAELGAMPG